MTAETCYHVFNRTGAELRVLESAGDCWRFIDLMNTASDRVPIDLLAGCLMPNHFHLVLRPHQNNAIGHWMKWLLTTHVRRWHARERTNGQIWQGRFKAFAIAEDEHLLRVVRYVERNALNAGLVDRAEYWPWGSLNWRHLPNPPMRLTPLPIPLPTDWTEYVNLIPSAEELAAIRGCVNRQTPYPTIAAKSGRK